MRAAADDFVGVLAGQHRGVVETCGGVSHSFTDTFEAAERIMALNVDIGVNGCSLKAEESLAVAARLPLDRLHLETDAPWCEVRPTHASWKHLSSPADPPPSAGGIEAAVVKPEKHRPGCLVKGRNEPLHIRRVAEAVYKAGSRSLSFAEFANKIYMNSCRKFLRVSE
eukprot:GHVU01109739.1.p1 GENE.GHVU01109739.1~~GHVU01109739.1.p1  ORF type:complete len:192 (+),score=29.50 GHVU01109739.1:73-576(+)